MSHFKALLWNGKTFDHVRFLAEPYAARPCAEGSYAITIPVSAPLMAALRDPYHSAFSTLE